MSDVEWVRELVGGRHDHPFVEPPTVLHYDVGEDVVALRLGAPEHGELVRLARTGHPLLLHPRTRDEEVRRRLGRTARHRWLPVLLTALATGATGAGLVALATRMGAPAGMLWWVVLVVTGLTLLVASRTLVDVEVRLLDEDRAVPAPLDGWSGMVLAEAHECMDPGAPDGWHEHLNDLAASASAWQSLRGTGQAGSEKVELAVALLHERMREVASRRAPRALR